ncbi:hypothetical protein OOL41_004733 [Salmonella enterica]|nr:hypothetical protein [Salmonella enterica]
MYGANRIQSNASRQTDSLTILQEVVKHFHFPACIRNSSGNFLFSNPCFHEKFMPDYPAIESWFSCQSADFLKVTSQTEVDVFLNSDSHFIVEDVLINDDFWSISFNLYNFPDQNYIVWSFNKSVKINYLFANNNSSSSLNYKIIDDFRSSIHKSVKWHAFNLYSGGLSHACISSILNISEGTSKNYGSEFLDFFSKRDRDELIVSLYRSGQFYRLYNNISQLIKNTG